MRKWSVASALVAVALLLARVSGQQSRSGDAYVAGEILVKFSQAVNASQRSALLAGRSANRIRRFDALNIEHVRLPPGLTVEAAVASFQRIPGIMLAQPNYSRRAIQSSPPNDPFWLDNSLWGLKKIQAQSVWTYFTTGDGSVVVASIDTGVNYNHPDLAANMWRNPAETSGNGIDDDGNGYVDDVYGIDTVNHDSNPMDDQGHGTHTSGTIAAVGNNGIGVVGVNWNAKVLACKFLDATGYGTDAGAIECFNYITVLKNRGVNIRVSSNSWGGPREGPPATALQAAIDAAGAAGIINIFGAGNDGTDNDTTPFDPASLSSPSIVAVASSGSSDSPSYFTNYGATSVDLAAPGEDIVSTYLGTSYASLSGTSMATPHVAGVAALLAKVDPTVSVEAIKAFLIDNVDPISWWSGLVASGGRLNAFRAANAASGNTSPSVSVTSPTEGATFTAPVTITIDATASDSDGSVLQVAFYANSVTIGTDTVSPYSLTWNAPMGSYTLTAVATDNLGATTTSAAVHVTVNPMPGRINVALAANGGVATASSTYSANYPPAGANNGDRKGLGWGAGGGWNDATLNVFPDWLEVDFNGSKLIDEVDVFSMQDSYLAPVEPTPTMTFAYYGLRAFEVQYWDGAAWVPVPGATVMNNTLVWRQVVFAAVTTYKIRVHVTSTPNGYSCLMEVEAWGVGSGVNTPPSVSITSPTEGATFTAPANITIDATASDSDGSIQQVAFYANGAPIGTDTTSPYSVTWANVTTGSYTLTAVATDNLGATTTSAAVHVTVVASNNPPSVSITGPTEGATFTAPASITIDATASDSDGSIQQVAFYANAAPIGTDTTSPYSLAWNNVAAGTYTLTAVATDNLGATTTSAAVHVTVNPMPGRMNVALAANGGVATASSTYNVNYPAAGTNNGDRKGLGWGAGGGWNDGTPNAFPDWLEISFSGPKSLDEVNVFSMQDNYTAPVEPTPTMTFAYYGVRTFEVQYWNGSVWVPVPGGTVTNNNRVWRQVVFAPVTTSRIRVYITSALGGYSRLTEVEAWGATPGGNSPPTVSITSPTEGATFTAPASITINATASDSDGSIQQVAFYANGAPIGTDTTSPYSFTWNNVVAGSYTLTAVATDNQGATTTSAAVHVTVVVGNTPPSVSITSPTEGATFTAPAAITIDATASDSDGSIQQVAFYANGAPIGTDTTSPYSLTWNNVTTGSYTLTAVATDNLGATTTSAAVHVTVNPMPGRMNVALAANGGVATASSIYSANYPAAGANNGDRKGLGWGAGGGWNDGTPNVFPDWLEVNFSGPMLIDEVNVFSLQNNYTAPVEPTPTMTFAYYGVRAFEVQYWNGAAWVPVPGGTVTNNNLVWRQVVFAPVTTSKIRIYITSALNGYSRLTEVEAWGVAATAPLVQASEPTARRSLSRRSGEAAKAD